jgi:hypothetical protein
VFFSLICSLLCSPFLAGKVFAQNYLASSIVYDEVIVSFRAKGDFLDVYKSPDLSSESYQIKVKPGRLIAFVGAKAVIKPSMTTTRQAIKLQCGGDLDDERSNVGSRTEVNVAPGEGVGYVMPLVPDGAILYYKGKFCSYTELDQDVLLPWILISQKKFSGIKEPTSEKWIRVVDGKKNFLGWFFLNDDKLTNYKNPQVTHKIVSYDE